MQFGCTSEQVCEYFVLFCSVLYCSVLFCSVLFCSVLFCSVLFCRGQNSYEIVKQASKQASKTDSLMMYAIWMHLTTGMRVLCSVLFCSVLSCPVLSCSVLFCSVLFCSVLSCSVL